MEYSQLSKKPPRRSPDGTPPPGKLPPKSLPTSSPLVNPISGSVKTESRAQQQAVAVEPTYDTTLVRSKVADPSKLKILTIIDRYGWAYDVGCSGLYKTLRTLYPEWILDKCTNTDVGKNVDPTKYDVVFIWAWLSRIDGVPKPLAHVINNIDFNRSIFILAGEFWFDQVKYIRPVLQQAHYMAGNNAKISKYLKRLSPYYTVYQLEYGVDLDHFRPMPFPKEFTVGFAGHKTRRLKRFWMAHEACKELGVPLKLATHVTDASYIPHKEMPDFYRDISCLLITSDSEAHPLVYYEALASGRPVVSTLVGDIIATAEDGENGYYLPINCSVDHIVDRLRRLRDDPKNLRYMGKQARISAETKWNWPLIVNKYIHAIEDVSNTFTACMLISRDNELMEKAVNSVVRQKPTEFRAYIDPVMLPDSKKARKILKKAGAKIFIQHTTDAKDHHVDVVESVHRAISEAEYKRVLWCDDDDEIIGNIRDLTHLVGSNIGILYGNVRQVWANGNKRHSKGARIKDPIHMNNMKGSVVIYNRDAFRTIHDNINHGYFWDYKIGYWMIRGDYTLRYVNQDLSIHNVNPSPSAKRKSLYGAWPSMVESMNKKKLKVRKH